MCAGLRLLWPGEATDAGRGGQNLFAQYGLAVLELGLGNYQADTCSARAASMRTMPRTSAPLCYPT